MELGQHPLQIIASLSLILTAAVVAFICDVLKRNNEQLREMNIELQTRQEARTNPPSPRVTERAPQAETPAPPAPQAPAVAPHAAAPKERSGLSKELNKDKKRAVNSQAIAAMERGAALAGTGVAPRSAPVRELKPEVVVVSPRPIAKPEPIAAPVNLSHTATQPSAAKKDWGALLSRNAQGLKATQTPAAPPSTEGLLPAGFHAGLHDGHVLNQLVQSRQPVSGLVVSIGVNASSKPDRKMPDAILKLVESLIGPNDFAAQSGEDEFLLIYPRESGASAQRRLSQIAQQLWDFQLRALGSFQILFSWGGVEVRSESIEEAVASASERMQETKRGRKLLTMSLAPAPDAGKDAQLRHAV